MVIVGVMVVVLLVFVALTIFFDQAVLIGYSIFYRADAKYKTVAITFDNGPSPDWTPRILD